MDEQVEAGDQIEELLPFYLLCSLRQEEQRQIEAYLAGHSEVWPEVAGLKQTMAEFAYSAPPVQPPARLKQALLERAAAETPARRPVPTQDSGGFWRRLWRPAAWGGPLRMATGGLALLGVILLGIWALVVYNEITWLHRQNAALQQELQAQREVLVALEAGPAPAEVVQPAAQQLTEQAKILAGLADEINQLRAENAALRQDISSQRWMMAQATSPDSQAMSLSGTETLPGAHGQLIANPNDASAVLIVSGLPALEPGLVYQFWLVEGDAQQGVGVFSVDAQGVGTLQISTEATIGSYDAMGITVEPGGGSQQPTGDMIMLGTFSGSS